MQRTLLIAVHVALLAGIAQAGPRVTIRMRSQASASDSLVCLKDVALVQSSDAALRAELESLDIWEFKVGDESTANIERSLVDLRLRLAGVDMKDVTLVGKDAAVTYITGPKVVQAAAAGVPKRPLVVPAAVFAPAKPAPGLPEVDDVGELLTDPNLELLVQNRIAENLQMSPEDVRVQLTSPCLSRLLPKDVYGQHGQIELSVSNAPNPGRITATFRVIRHRQLVTSAQPQFDLALRQKVLKARRPLTRRMPVQEGDIVLEEEWLIRNEPRPDLADTSGAVMTRDVGVGQLLRLSDFQRPIQKDQLAPEFVVKAQDRVQMTATKGRVSVTANDVEAQQAGKVGDWIRCKNMASGKIVTARVVGPARVEIPL
jgi:flagella basal body P-ring formation protein FlgA